MPKKFRPRSTSEIVNKIYLACSFDPKDCEVVRVFTKICRSFDMYCVNVITGSTLTPPAEARKLIRDSQALVAIVTRREEVRPGVFKMPVAVDEEISMAYSLDKPILIFIEKGVDTTTGFIRNYATYLEFDRGSLLSPEFIQKIIAMIYHTKLELISPKKSLIFQRGLQNVFVEKSESLIELLDNSGSFMWRYSQRRRLSFTAQLTKPIKIGAWGFVPININLPSDHIRWSYHIEGGTKPFRFANIVEKRTLQTLIVFFDIDPKPESGDAVEYTILFESPYLNPVYLEDVPDNHSPIIINGQEYLCYDGQMPWMESKNIKIQLRFPAIFGMKPQNIVPFVASHTHGFDYLVEEEMKRINVVDDSFGGNVFIEISVQNPWLRHIYGFAWNPPSKNK